MHKVIHRFGGYIAGSIGGPEQHCTGLRGNPATVERRAELKNLNLPLAIFRNRRELARLSILVV